MSLTKKDISKRITSEMKLSTKESSFIVNAFLDVIKKNVNNSIVKINGFGSFCYKTTPKRIGRNPKDLKSYIIPAHKKLFFLPSKITKGSLN